MNPIKEFRTTVCGIQCIIKIYSWEPYVPGKLSGPPEDCFPADGGYGDYDVCDSKGNKASWIVDKMDDDDRDVLELEIFHAMEQDH